VKKQILTAILAIACLMSIIATPALANFSCQGSPNVSMSIGSGTIAVDIGYGTWYLCSVDREVKGISPKQCQVITNGLLLSKATNKKVAVYFTAVKGDGQNCSNMGSWKYPVVRHYHVYFMQ
jgi:hypothetical protein